MYGCFRYRSADTVAYDRFREGIEPMPGIHALLGGLTVPYCVASSGPREQILLHLELTGLRRYFPDDHVFSSYEINSWKPDPGIFLHAAKEMGFRQDNTAVIEDSVVLHEARDGRGFGGIRFPRPEVDAAFDFDSTAHHPLAFMRLTMMQDHKYRGDAGAWGSFLSNLGEFQ